VFLKTTIYNWEIVTFGVDMKAKTAQRALKQFLLQDCAGFGLGRSNRPCQCVIHGQTSCTRKSNQEKMVFVSDTFGLIFSFYIHVFEKFIVQWRNQQPRPKLG
jgi:hypothetical protein